jgi:hypothetical protein
LFVFYITGQYFILFLRKKGMVKEFVVTGQLQQRDGGQTLILHHTFLTTSRETAIEKFHKHFEPELKILKIYSVVDDEGNLV